MKKRSKKPKRKYTFDKSELAHVRGGAAKSIRIRAGP